LPVEQVWKDVQEFIKKLNEKEGTGKYCTSSRREETPTMLFGAVAGTITPGTVGQRIATTTTLTTSTTTSAFAL
jgi:hypothetical protein